MAMRWKPSTSGEDLFLRLDDGLGRSIQVTASNASGLDFLTSQTYFVGLVRTAATLEVFLNCLRTAKAFVREQSDSAPLLLGKELGRTIDLPRSLWADRQFCEVAKQAGKVANEKKRNDKVEKAATRGAPRVCSMCGVALNTIAKDNNKFTVEHLWPLALGGETIESNLVPMCLHCNNKRDNALSWASLPILDTFHIGKSTPSTLTRISLGLARLVRVAENEGGRPLTLKEAVEQHAPLYRKLALKDEQRYLYVDLFNMALDTA